MGKELLLKYIDGDCSEIEKVEIATWLDSSPEHMKEFMALRKLQDITIWQTMSDAQSGKTDNIKQPLGRVKRIYLEIIKVAAVLMVAFLVFRYISPESGSRLQVAMQTLHVPSGQRAELILEDGTKVWLNAKTTLTFPNQFSGHTREVHLDGEGFFEVTSNKEKPFIVKTDKYDVKVWGTRFNLMAYSGYGIFETSLLEGAVEVLSSGSSKGVMLKPDERIFQKNDQLVVAPIVETNHFLWKEGIISFDNESFPDMVKKLELYFDLKVTVKNDKLLKYRCTGKFRTKDGVEHILKVLQLSNQFSYKIDDKQNIVTIE